ncbi:MAG: copper amine oxidase N-terminal domain-containing protein, partial [Anaerotignum sp.]|nr:copper amine oxidase N-terminal domain-containing protein [Anaerotignum sp.]
VSSALGVDTNNVLWNAETKTVTIMFAQRIISMTVGQKTVYVNGSPIPTSAAPEITNGRTYLPLRDLGTALGVTNVSWDAATKTATLN